MKPFKLLWDNKELHPHKTRMIGLAYQKEQQEGVFGLIHIVTVWYWRKYRSFKWIN